MPHFKLLIRRAGRPDLRGRRDTSRRYIQQEGPQPGKSRKIRRDLNPGRAGGYIHPGRAGGYIHPGRAGGYILPGIYTREAIYHPGYTPGRLYTPGKSRREAIYTREEQEGGYTHPGTPAGRRLYPPRYTYCTSTVPFSFLEGGFVKVSSVLGARHPR